MSAVVLVPVLVLDVVGVFPLFDGMRIGGSAVFQFVLCCGRASEEGETMSEGSREGVGEEVLSRIVV